MYYIVTGMARSGTHALLHACEAGGMDVDYRYLKDYMLKQNGVLRYGADPQPYGGWREGGNYVEGEVCKKYPYDLLADLSAFKIHPAECSVRFMIRPPHERLKSYTKNFIAADYFVIHETQGEWDYVNLLRPRFPDFKVVPYHSLLNQPVAELERIGWPMDYIPAAQAIRRH